MRNAILVQGRAPVVVANRSDRHEAVTANTKHRVWGRGLPLPRLTAFCL